MWPYSEKGKFWPIGPIPRVGLSASKIFGTMLLHSWFSLIWYTTWLSSDKGEFAVVLLLLTFCLLLLPLCESVIVLCFVVRYFMSILVLQSSWWGRESWLLCLICLPGVSWWLSGSSSRCHGVVCSLWLWYFLIILIYYFWPTDPILRVRSMGVCAQNICYHVAAFVIFFN